MSNVAALIMAAGTGERFEGPGSKILYPLLGRPVLVWSAERFALNRSVASITVVVCPGDEHVVREVLEKHRVSKIAQIVAGGDTRQESVGLGLDALGSTYDTVLVHDAARPCVTPLLIDRILEALRTDGAVIPVWPAVDTLVREEGGVVDAILDRVHISSVQTPQGFRAELLLRAHRNAKERGLSSSDDGSVVFALGEPVRTIAGERGNIKVTYVEDAPVAEAILERQRL
jgi:2-C-methyl-D-erythritol 4-phosphate cytidylyltransferase